MLTLNDIINVSFKKANFSGYRMEDVDNFIDQVGDSYDALIKKTIEQKEQLEALEEENKKLIQKIDVLAEKIEEYRNEEDEIKNALVSAQKLGEASIREARHKAEIIVKDANLKADRIVANAKIEIAEQQKQLDNLKKAVSDFRSKMLDVYREHLTLIDALPVQKPKKETPTEKEEVVAEREDSEPILEPQEEETPVVEEPTQEFTVNDSFEARRLAPEHDLRYDKITFTEDESVSDEENG